MNALTAARLHGAMGCVVGCSVAQMVNSLLRGRLLLDKTLGGGLVLDILGEKSS